jgi:FkbM family methyltransferase
MRISSFKRLLEFDSVSRYAPPSLVLREIAWRYYWSGEPEVRLLKKLVRPHSNSVDVGVAVGNYTYHLSRLSAQVYAFEPNPTWVNWLRRCTPRNVTVLDVALSNCAGAAILSVPRLDGKTPCRSAATIGDNFEAKSCERITVQKRMLDEYELDNVGFIKIDVEGQEMAVLNGAQRTLERSRPVLLVEVVARLSRMDLRSELAMIEQFGYEGFFLFGGRLRSVAELNPERHQPNVSFDDSGAEYIANFIFKPRESRDSLEG